MSTIKVDTIEDTTGAEQYTSKAWINFDGTGTINIRESGNISSVLDIGTGNYAPNFSSPLVDANYAVTGMGQRPSFNDVYASLPRGTTPVQTTSSMEVFFFDTSANTQDVVVGSLNVTR